MDNSGVRQDAGMTIPYGAWPSPISAADRARGSLSLSFPGVVGGDVWWTEGRPDESGRQAIVRTGADGRPVDLLPPPWNARTRVHEYGGRSWLAVPPSSGAGVPHGSAGAGAQDGSAGAGAPHGSDGYALVFANYADQRLYRLDPGAAEPVPITPEPASPAAGRYADLTLTPDGSEIWCVRESQADGAVSRALVAVPVGGGAPRVLLRDGHFLAHPRISPDGRRLAWLTWDHPRMPWDGTELRVADLGADGSVGQPRTVLGGPAESELQPEWAGPGMLYALSDRSGWWNLYELPAGGGEPRPLCPREEEFGGPLWQLGNSWYAPLADGRIAVRHGTDTYRVGLLDPATGDLADLDLPYTTWAGLTGDGSTLTAVVASPRSGTQLLRFDPATGGVTVPRRAAERLPDPAYLPVPRSRVVPGPGGRDVHVHVYPPTHPTARAPEGERPPYLVHIHGGPTSQSMAELNVGIAYYTSRGLGVLDVNYGGSTGYGREYRQRLRGRLDRPGRAGRHRRVRLRHVLLRGGRAGAVRRGHPRLRVPLPGRAGRAAARGAGGVRATGAAVTRGRPVLPGAAAAGRRGQGGASEPGGDVRRGAGQEGDPVRVPALRGGGARVPQGGDDHRGGGGRDVVLRPGDGLRPTRDTEAGAVHGVTPRPLGAARGGCWCRAVRAAGRGAGARCACAAATPGGCRPGAA